MLTNEEINRYQRHFLIEDFSEKDQVKLKEAKILLVGLGGLGSPISLYLSSSGFGNIGIIDDDVVSESNLQRQILYTTLDLNKPKAHLAKERLEQLNPNIKVNSYDFRLDEEKAFQIINNYDLVIDGTDNYKTRYIIDNITKELGKPYIYGAVQEFKGQVSVFNYKNKISYSDVFPSNNINESNPIGVFGPVPGIIGSIEVLQAISIITGKENVLDGKLLTLDFRKYEFNLINLV